MSAPEFDIDPRCGKYGAPLPIETAITYATEMIEEWDWAEDAHGYCHTRPMLIALVKAATEARS